MKKLLELLGWYGVGAILLAYALVSFSVLSSTGIWYQVLNGTGALGIVLGSLDNKDYQPMVLNVIWTLIALVAIGKMVFAMN